MNHWNRERPMTPTDRAGVAQAGALMSLPQHFGAGRCFSAMTWLRKFL